MTTPLNSFLSYMQQMDFSNYGLQEFWLMNFLKTVKDRPQRKNHELKTKDKSGRRNVELTSLKICQECSDAQEVYREGNEWHASPENKTIIQHICPAKSQISYNVNRYLLSQLQEYHLLVRYLKWMTNIVTSLMLKNVNASILWYIQ